MNNKVSIAIATLAFSLGTVAHAGVTYKKGDKYIKLGGRIQLQYHQVDPDGGETTDDLLFRRLRPYIEGSVHKDWKGKFQWDMGKSDLAVKDAYMEYKGFDNMKVRIGNVTFPFSREQMTSSKKQQLVERTFVGDHNYGSPDRNVGLHVSGHSEEKTFQWGFAAASASIDPDNKKLDFDTPIQFDKGHDFSDGWIVGGRVEWQPLGKFKFSQGDFKNDPKIGLGAAVFTWSNDDDNLDPSRSKKDVDNVTGFEISAAMRFSGFSADLQYNLFQAELVEAGITSGLYRNSETDLESWAFEGGYMIVPSKLELVAGYQLQDADNYTNEWTRTSLGFNWYLKKHKIKFQTTYRINEDKDGKAGNDVDELYLQAQYVF